MSYYGPGHPTRCRWVVERLSKWRGILTAAEVERLIDRYCEKHFYPKCLVMQHAFHCWFMRPFVDGREWYSYEGRKVDIEIEPPTFICAYCWQPSWIQTERYGAHCGRRGCRAVFAFWTFGGWREGRISQCPQYTLYCVAEFLRRMAKPKSPRAREFAKRYPHMKASA